MKKSINHILLLVTASSLLVACSPSRDTSPSTSSSTKTLSSSSKSTKAETSNSKPEKTSNTESTQNTVSQSSPEANTQTSTEPTLAQDTTTNTTFNMSATSKQELRSLPNAPLSPLLVGRWEGSSQQARHIEMTITEDGSRTVTADFRESDDDDKELYIQTHTAQLTKVVEYKPNHYAILEFNGDVSALLPGLTGLGGNILPGFTIENGQYKPLLIGQPFDSDDTYIIDLNDMRPLGNSVLTKVQ